MQLASTCGPNNMTINHHQHHRRQTGLNLNRAGLSVKDDYGEAAGNDPAATAAAVAALEFYHRCLNPFNQRLAHAHLMMDQLWPDDDDRIYQNTSEFMTWRRERQSSERKTGKFMTPLSLSQGSLNVKVVTCCVVVIIITIMIISHGRFLQPFVFFSWWNFPFSKYIDLKSRKGTTCNRTAVKGQTVWPRQTTATKRPNRIFWPQPTVRDSSSSHTHASS